MKGAPEADVRTALGGGFPKHPLHKIACIGALAAERQAEGWPGRGGRAAPATMEDHETRRRIIRQWMALPKDKRQTAEQAAAFAERAVQQNELQRSRLDPHQRVMGWLLPRVGRE